MDNKVKIISAIFNASLDDKDNFIEFKETQILLKNYLKDKKCIKEFKKIYFSSEGYEKRSSLNSLLENEYGISFRYATQFNKDDLRLQIVLKDNDKYLKALTLKQAT